MRSEFVNPLSIVLAAIIVAGAIVTTQLCPRFQIAASMDADGNPFVWRTQTRTGEIRACHLEKDPNPFNQFAPTPVLIVRCQRRSEGRSRVSLVRSLGIVAVLEKPEAGEPVAQGHPQGCGASRKRGVLLSDPSVEGLQQIRLQPDDNLLALPSGGGADFALADAAAPASGRLLSNPQSLTGARMQET
jgi:hypothetical protein